MDLCPCGLGEPYDECCGRFHSGAAEPPTAEALMRARYSAFAKQDEDFVHRTYHSTTRPKKTQLDPETSWLRLDVLTRTAGGLFDPDGTVEFRAIYRAPDADGKLRRGELHEVSRFTREDGHWRYLDGTHPA